MRKHHIVIAVIQLIAIASPALSADAAAAGPDPASVVAAEKAKRGAFNATFFETAPDSDAKSLTKTYLWRPDPEKIADYDITELKFPVYIPKAYEDGQPHGLIVFIGAHLSGHVPGDYRSVLDAHRLLGVGLHRFVRDRKQNHVYAMTLDAAHNMRRRYTIDDERIYLVGLRGGASYASRIAPLYPQHFSGGFYMLGAQFYRRLTNPEDAAKPINPSFPAPSGVTARLLRTSRFVIMSARNANDRAASKAIFEEGYQRDKLGYSVYMELDAVPRSHAAADEFRKGLLELDKPLAAAADRLMDTAERAEKAQRYGEAWALYVKVAARAAGSDLAGQAEAKIGRLEKRRADDLAFVAEALSKEGQAQARLAADKHRRDWGDLSHPSLDAVLAGKSPSAGPVASARPAPMPDDDAAANDTTDDAAGDEPDTAPPSRTGPPSRAQVIEKFAAEKLDKAKELLAEDVAEGYEALIKVADQYAATGAGKEARKLAEQVMADDAKRAAIELAKRQALAVAKLSLAKRYLRADNRRKAEAILKEIISEYPDTPAAKDAAALLNAPPQP